MYLWEAPVVEGMGFVTFVGCLLEVCFFVKAFKKMDDRIGTKFIKSKRIISRNN